MKKLNTYLVLVTGVLLFATCTDNKQNNNYVHPNTAQADTNVVLPPSWAFGVMYGSYTNQEGTIRRVDDIIAHDYPIDAY